MGGTVRLLTLVALRVQAQRPCRHSEIMVCKKRGLLITLGHPLGSGSPPWPLGPHPEPIWFKVVPAAKFRAHQQQQGEPGSMPQRRATPTSHGRYRMHAHRFKELLALANQAGKTVYHCTA